MKIPEKKLLLAFDFHKQSLVALEYAMHYAQAKKLEVDIVHAIEEGNFLSRMLTSDGQKEKIRVEAENLIRELLRKYDSETKVAIHVRYGKPYDEIEAVAEEIQPVFVLMGKTEDPSIRRSLLGSNSLHLIRESKFPVITIRGSEMLPAYGDEKKIILPLDFGSETHEQITAAIEYGLFFDAKIQIISVLEKDSVGKEMYLLTGLDKAKKLIEKAGVKVSTELIKGAKKSIHNVIVEYAEAQNAYMVIIMTQEESNFVKYFVGSTAQEVINLSPIPVMSVIPWVDPDDSVFSQFVDPLGVFIAP